MHAIQRLLIVEDSPALRRTLSDALRPRVQKVECASSVAEALTSLRADPPDVMLLDIGLPDGTGFQVLDAAIARSPIPLIIALSGEAGPEESFRLAQRGVRAFLRKPVTLPALETALEEALSTPPDVTPLLRASVGKAKLHTLEDHVRRTLVAEAMARSSGSKSAAARLLSVSRQVLQHMLHGLEDI